MAYNTITYESDERVAIITLNRPERLNALSLELCGEVADAVGKADKDEGVRTASGTPRSCREQSAGAGRLPMPAPHQSERPAVRRA